MIGIIGGTGLYSMEGLKISLSHDVDTPFGKPSAPVVRGKLGGHEVCFLPRHGLHHGILPGEINFRANIWALKSVGVRQIISVSATGSLVEEIKPGDLALANQYFDWTKGRRSSFFGDGIVAHISTAEPACPALSARVVDASKSSRVAIHTAKTYACVEGPRLGTRAESFFLRGAGAHLVGMTNVPEAFLAREAQLCYCTIAVATDYDCWKDDPDSHVSLDKVLALYKESLSRVTQLLGSVISQAGDSRSCGCRQALKEAVLTPESSLAPEKRQFLAFLKE